MREDINIIALVKGNERYIFLYSDEKRAETLKYLGRFASNQLLSFTWYDAAVMSQKIRQETQLQNSKHHFSTPLTMQGGDE